MAEITNIHQARKRRRNIDQGAREERLLEVLDELVHAFWQEGIRLSDVKVRWSGDEDYIREAKGKQI